MKFKPGDKVVCIDANGPIDPNVFEQWVIKNEEYTIRGTRAGLEGHYGVLLEEIRNTPVYITGLFGKAEPGFAERRFVKKEKFALSNTEVNVLEEVLCN